MAPHWWLFFVKFKVTLFTPPLPNWKGIDLQVVFQGAYAQTSLFDWRRLNNM